MKSTLLTSLALSPLALAITLQSQAEPLELDKVTVSADFRNNEVQDLPEAITVVGEQLIEQRSAEHLEQVLSFAPNVNFSSGSSRARYFQIRGIGERSQFIDPINPSVGVMIDGIDMTGLGGAATLLDVEQVEILRGPQGTRFGANALAGMINIQSKAPTKETEGFVKAKLGNYGTHGESGAISGSLTDKVQARLAISSLQSEGYIENKHLDKKNTNNIDEVIARGKLVTQLSADTELAFSYFYADIDNGYDAFSLDKNRTTLSDKPGTDAQESHAFAVDINHKLSNALTLEAVVTTAKSDVEYSYDEDWAFDGFHPDGYNSTDEYLRDFQRSSIDVRLLSGQDGRIFSDTTDWVVGIYHQQRSEELERNNSFKSDLDIAASSVYGELSTVLSERTSLTYGLRAEQWNNDFTNSNNTDADEEETLVGGKITLESLIAANHLAYTSLARGYKPGGSNSSDKISKEDRLFDTETNNTLELGLKSSLLNDSWKTRVAAFYIQRKDQQVKQSFAGVDEDNKPEFTDFIANAAEGRNQGIEVESSWQLIDNLRWDLALGYLDTEFIDYEFNAKDKSDPTKITVKDGRAQGHAPEYSFSTALIADLSDSLVFTVESEGKDSFYFSDSHDEKSKEYVLWHARLAYSVKQFDIALYGRNLTGKEQEVRGFGFANDPRDGWTNTRWTQLGEPRLVGIEGRYNF